MNSSNGEVYVALLCLAFCAFYGASATSIDLFGSWQHELMTSRTFPYVLAVVGSGCSLSILYSALRSRSMPQTGIRVVGRNWLLCAGLVGLALAYAYLLPRIGFLLSTTAFLFTAVFSMGERRWRLLVPAAVLPPVVFWLLLEIGLDIKLPSMAGWGG